MTTGLNAGKLRRKLTFQSRSTSRGSMGGQVQTWTDAFTRYGSINTLSGAELIRAQAVNAEATHSIVTRYTTEFADPIAVAKMRILYRGRTLDILASDNVDEANFRVVLLASEGRSLG